MGRALNEPRRPVAAPPFFRLPIDSSTALRPRGLDEVEASSFTRCTAF
jgi:hypothetical protein